MNVGEFLPAARIVIPLPAKTLHDAAEQLIGCFVETGLTDEGGKLLERLSETPAREAVVSGGGAFILHFRSDAVSEVGAALGVTATPVELESDSERTARVVIVLVAPYYESSTFIQAVSALDRALGDEEVVERIAAAKAVEDVVAVDALMDASLPGYLTVRDVMTLRPRSVWPDATLSDVARIMSANRVGALPVTSETGEVLGMVTYRDILRVTLPRYLRSLSSGESSGGPPEKVDEEADPRRIPVRDVMDRSVLCVSEDQTLADVASTIVGKGVDRLPVVREGGLVGMLTRGDIVRRLYGP
jgi:CBS domain-containing protein